MFKFSTFVCLVISIVAFACKEIDKLLTFDINHSQDLTFSSGFPLNTIQVLAPVNVTTNSQDEFKNNRTKAELVKNVSLSSLKLTIIDPATEDFSFLKSVEVFISLPDDTKEIRLAHAENIPENINNALELTSTNAKLDEYLKAPSYKLRTKVVYDEYTTKNYTIRADMKFKVTADPF
jgi:hypothetical protein